MKVLITGAHGLLGQKLALIFAQESTTQLLLTDLAASTFFVNPRYEYQQLDITRLKDVKSLVAAYQPDVIINTAALTNVDACEEDKVNAWKLNVDGVKNLIIAARKLDGARIVQLSSDYVFSGDDAPYDELSRPRPLSYYGKSKLAAENALLSSPVEGTIVRTQVLYGTGFQLRSNFVSWTLSMLEQQRPFRVVTDQVGNPTMADDLAYGILRLVEKRQSGVYHVSGPEALSRHAFARTIADVFGFDSSLIDTCTSVEIGQAADRPADSTFVTLKFEAACDYRLSKVRDGLRRLASQYRDGASHLDLLSDERFL